MRINRMTLTMLAAIAVLAAGAMSLPAHAQLRGASKAPPKPARDPKAQALYDWANHMGMLRGVREVDAIATLELSGAGTISVMGRPCSLTDYRASVNYQEGGMRVMYSCTRPDSTSTGARSCSSRTRTSRMRWVYSSSVSTLLTAEWVAATHLAVASS